LPPPKKLIYTPTPAQAFGQPSSCGNVASRFSRARRPPLRFQFFGLPPTRARSLLSKAQQPGSFVLDLKIFSCSPIEGAKGAVNVEAVMESSLRIARNEIRHRARLVKVYGNVPEVE
jgi:hypothetical protein